MSNPCDEVVEEKTVYRILNKETNTFVGVYTRSCSDEFDFKSYSAARNANCHGVYLDEDRYDVVALKRLYIRSDK